MSAPFRHRVSPAVIRRALFLGLVGALLMGVTVAYTVTATNLGPAGGGSIKLVNESFSDDADVTVASKRIYKYTSNASAVGASAPGMEATSALPQVNNSISRNDFVYKFEVKEAANNSWQSGENFKIEVYMDNGSTNSLIATLYTKQVDLVDDGSVEGVTVVASTGSKNVVGNLFSIIITRQ
ncbi:MAG: hypothetical protein HYX93_02850 [Chloroflexi bacterium]|nr:hypothetical protein [Chloroflexota bacterium]